MLVATNAHYKRSRRRKQMLAFAAFILLFIAAMVSLFVFPQVPYVAWAAWPLVIIGYFISSISRQMQFEDGVAVTTETRIARALAPLSNRYWLGSYVPIGRLIVPHVLIGPEGVLVIQPRNQTGQTTVQDGRWQHKTSFFTRLMAAEPPIGDPAGQLHAHIEAVEEEVKALGHENVPVSGVVLFTSPDARVSIANCPITVLSITQLTAWANSRRSPNTVLDEATRRALTEHFDELIPEKVAVEQEEQKPQSGARRGRR